MALTIQTSPNVGAVGATVEITTTGTPTAVQTHTVTPELRFYIRSGPATSKLPTLDQYDELELYRAGTITSYGGPLDINTTRDSLRLRATPGGATFTPDAPGVYTLEVFDVSAYSFLPTFGGNVPATGELAEVDNEEAALPAYAGGTAQAPSDTGTLYVFEEKSRVFGVAPHTATLTVRTYGDTIHLLDPDRVKLTPASTAIAKAAASDRDVARVLADIRNTTSNLFENLVVRLDIGSSYSDGNALSQIVSAWGNHVQTTVGYALHGIPDATNTVAGSTATDLASAIVRLNNLRTAYNAHVVYTTGTVHAFASPGDVTAHAACTNLATALTLWADLRLKLSNHGENVTAHPPGVGGVTAVDGAMTLWTEPPQNEDELVTQVEDLITVYNGHRSRDAFSAPHAAQDSDNVLSTSGIDWTTISKDAAYQVINKLCDALERHAANLDENSAPAGSAYHNNGSTIRIAARASDDVSAANAVELLMVHLERHFNSDTEHGDKVLGRYAPARTTSGVRWCLAPRLSRAWYYATSAAAAAVPSNANESAASLTGYGWT